MRKTITWTNDEGKTEISPLANPFMPYDELTTLRINGGWNELGERTIARWYTMYATITQSRDWLPNEVGGVVWLAWDNVATSIYVPIYSSIESVPDSYKFVQYHLHGCGNRFLPETALLFLHGFPPAVQQA